MQENPNKGPHMTTLPKCPSCSSEYTYEDGEMYVCPECAHEWAKSAAESAGADNIVRDAFGNVLNDGDSVTVIKDLKIKGSSSVVKVGTKVRNIHCLGRPRYRLQDRRHRRYAVEIGVRQEGMKRRHAL